MKRFSEVDLSALRWMPATAGVRGFDLLAGDDVIGELRWAKPHGSLATVKVATETWTLKRSGFLKPTITVRAQPGGEEVGQFAYHVHGWVLTAGAGPALYARKGFLLPTWEFADAEGHPLLHIEAVREGAKLEGGLVVVSPAGAHRTDCALLIFAGWYHIVLAWFEEQTEARTESAVIASSGYAPEEKLPE
jgi:hypothetical protein